MSRYRPSLKVLNYGESGARKSSFAKTFPKPLLVWMFDPVGKEMPYLKDYENKFLPEESISPVQYWEIGKDLIIPYQDIQQSDGLIRIEHYQEQIDIKSPRASKIFHARLAMFHHEYTNWASLSIDSVTGLEFICRKDGQYNLLVGDKYDNRHYYGFSSQELEELIAFRFPSMPINVIAISHIHIKETGEMGGDIVKLLSLPGQLKKTAARSWMEYYHSFIGPNPTNTQEETGLIQTKTGGRYYAATQIEAPNPCLPFYWNLWENFDA